MKTQKIGSPIHRAWRQLKLHLEGLTASKGVSADEAHAVGFIAAYGPVSMGEISRVLGLKPSTLTSMVDRLEGHGLVKRQYDKANRRQVLVAIKAKGQCFAEEGWAELDALEKRISAHVSQRDLEGFAAVLAAMDKEIGIQVRQESNT